MGIRNCIYTRLVRAYAGLQKDSCQRKSCREGKEGDTHRIFRALARQNTHACLGSLLELDKEGRGTALHCSAERQREIDKEKKQKKKVWGFLLKKKGSLPTSMVHIAHSEHVDLPFPLCGRVDIIICVIRGTRPRRPRQIIKLNFLLNLLVMKFSCVSL